MMEPLIGHDEPTRLLGRALEGSAMPHAWIFGGPHGIGKASLARQFACALLSDPTVAQGTTLAVDRRTSGLFENGSHPDFAMLERLEKAVKGSDETKRARGISVDQVRGLSRLLNMGASLGGRRVVMIDSADDLETAAANALLKSLEEPPANVVFLLISHVPGRLLPTIRSRCRMLMMRPLAEAQMEQVVSRMAPDLRGPEKTALIREADGAPGRLIEMLGLDIAGLQAALDIVAKGDEAGQREASRLAAALAPASSRERLAAFLDLVPRTLARAARTAAPAALGPILARWNEVKRLADGAIVPYQLEPGALVLSICAALATPDDSAGAAR
jgi:DNA polymerase III subunit delta'